MNHATGKSNPRADPGVAPRGLQQPSIDLRAQRVSVATTRKLGKLGKRAKFCAAADDD